MTFKVDAECRLVLPEEFAGKTVEVEFLGKGRLIVRIAKSPRRRLSLSELMAGVTEETVHGPVEFGPPVGGEAL